MKKSLIEEFGVFNEQHRLASKKKRILLAVSGGVDSVVLFELFRLSGFNFAVAHCNFGLRGTESDEDEKFVEQLAASSNMQCYVKKFAVEEYVREKKVSVQMAARQLRYDWFNTLCAAEKFDFVATAHHLNDNIETSLFNLAKGTGLKGLRGMLPKQGKIIRPLLFAPREEIEAFAQNQKLLWREDSSNASDKHSRNFIRHHIIPLFKEINPAFEQTFANNLRVFGELEQQFETQLNQLSKRLFFERGGETHIAINMLKKLPHKRSVLFAKLQPFGFTASQVDDILSGLDGNAGRQFLAGNTRLIQDRKFLILTNAKEKDSSLHIIDETTAYVSASGFKLTIEKLQLPDFKIDPSPNVALVDAAKLEFPLTLRRWKAGDYFYPMGMKEKKKKVKKFLTDLKVPLHKKEKVWVLESGKKIVWVAGFRIDERFKIKPDTRSVLKFSLSDFNS